MARSKRPKTFFEAETRIVEIDETLLSLSEETRLELYAESEAQLAHRKAIAAERTVVNLAVGSEHGTTKFNPDDYSLASFSQVMTALRPPMRLDSEADFDHKKTESMPRFAQGSCPPSFEELEVTAPPAEADNSPYVQFEAAPTDEKTELRPQQTPAGPYCAVNAPDLAAYQITREIASGGMGIVYEAFHRQTGKQVAVKYMREVSAQQAKLVKRFLGEGIATSRIDHPGVPEIYDYGHDNDGVPFLVMEYLEGEDLGTRLSRGPLTPPEFLEISRQLVDVLAAAHNHGIVHRDLKPDNIFLVSGDKVKVKLVDFGVAKFLDDQHMLGATSEGQVLGTPYYMSPEQCAGSNVDKRADIYSLGCVFYQMIAGKVPFPGNIFDVLIGHRQKQPLPLRALCQSIPPALDQLIALMMNKTPENRAQSMEDVAAALASIASGNHGEAALPTRERRPSRANRPTRTPRSRATAHHGALSPGAKRSRKRHLISITFAGLALVAATTMTLLAVL